MQLKAFYWVQSFSANALLWIDYSFNKRSSESQPQTGFPGPKEGSLFIVSLRLFLLLPGGTRSNLGSYEY